MSAKDVSEGQPDGLDWLKKMDLSRYFLTLKEWRIDSTRPPAQLRGSALDNLHHHILKISLPSTFLDVAHRQVACDPIKRLVNATMLNFADLKAKAGKAKDATVSKVTNTRDRYTSTSSSRVNWDPNWKRATPPLPGSPRPAQTGPPPPPTRSRADVSGTSTAPPTVHRASRPSEDMPPPPPYAPLPPPRRAASGYPPSHGQRDDAVVKIDWANLSTEDKEAFFGWLDEFFSRYLGIGVGPHERGSVSASAPASVSAFASVPAVGTPPVHRPPPVMSMRAPPPVNRTSRPQD